MSAVLQIDQSEPMPDRKTFVGGSDAAAILGVSPWATPVECWLQKTGRELPQPIDPIREKIFARGKKLEPVILDMVLDKLREQGNEVELIATNKRYRDPEHSWMSVEIDFELILNGEHINGDCKSVVGFARRKWGDEDTEDVPIEYAAQFMQGLSVTGRKKCLVAALIGLDDVAIYWVFRDDETIAAMREKICCFWYEHVLKDITPDPIVFDDIKLLFPHDNGLSIEATPEIAAKVWDLKQIKDKIKTLEDHEAMLKFDIAEFISPFALLYYNGQQIATWKGRADNRIDVTRLRDEQPEIAAQYTKNGTARVLLLKKVK